MTFALIRSTFAVVTGYARVYVQRGGERYVVLGRDPLTGELTMSAWIDRLSPPLSYDDRVVDGADAVRLGLGAYRF